MSRPVAMVFVLVALLGLALLVWPSDRNVPRGDGALPLDDRVAPMRLQPADALAAAHVAQPRSLLDRASSPEPSSVATRVVDGVGRGLAEVVAVRLRPAPASRQRAEAYWPVGEAGRSDAAGAIPWPVGVALLLVGPEHGPLVSEPRATAPAEVELPSAALIDLALVWPPDATDDEREEALVFVRCPSGAFTLTDTRLRSEVRERLALPGRVLARTTADGLVLQVSPDDDRLVLFGLRVGAELDVEVLDTYGARWGRRRLSVPGAGRRAEALALTRPEHLLVTVRDERGVPLCAEVRVLPDDVVEHHDTSRHDIRDVVDVRQERVVFTDELGVARVSATDSHRLRVEVSADGYVTRGVLADVSGSLPVVLEPAHRLQVSWRDGVHDTPIDVDHVRVSWLDDDGRWRDSPGGPTRFHGVPWRDVRVQADLGGEVVEVWSHPREGLVLGELGCRGGVAVTWPTSGGASLELRRLPEGTRRLRVGGMRYPSLEPGRWELHATAIGDGRQVGPLAFDVHAHETTSLDLREPADHVEHEHPLQDDDR